MSDRRVIDSFVREYGIAQEFDLVDAVRLIEAWEKHEKFKPADQSAEDSDQLAKRVWADVEYNGKGAKLIESDRAAQRQAGREEALVHAVSIEACIKCEESIDKRHVALVEKMSTFLGVCVPIAGKTLADVYKPASNGCLFCTNCAEVCPYLISLDKAKGGAV